jgi:hypothetical protein
MMICQWLVALAFACSLQLQPLECSSLPALLPNSSNNGRQLLNTGTCTRGAIDYAVSGSPFLTSSISFDPILAGAYTEAVVLFSIDHATCQGDKIIVQLSGGFAFEPPDGVSIDPEFLDVGAGAKYYYSKYSGAWDETATRLIFTYIDPTPTGAMEQQYLSLAASSGLRLPAAGLASNEASIKIAVAQGAPSTTTSSLYPFVTTQAAVLVSNVSVHMASVDALPDIFPPFPYRSWWCSNFSCANLTAGCFVWREILLKHDCRGACPDESLNQDERDGLCKQWRHAQTSQTSAECFTSTTAVPSYCDAFLKYCGPGDGSCPPLLDALESSSVAVAAFAEAIVVAEPRFSGSGRDILRPVSASRALLQLDLSLSLELVNDDLVHVHLPGFYCSPCNSSYTSGV